jgi:hypothetical protein
LIKPILSNLTKSTIIIKNVLPSTFSKTLAPTEINRYLDDFSSDYVMKSPDSMNDFLFSLNNYHHPPEDVLEYIKRRKTTRSKSKDEDPKNFSGKNIVGESFVGQDLINANFMIFGDFKRFKSV